MCLRDRRTVFAMVVVLMAVAGCGRSSASFDDLCQRIVLKDDVLEQCAPFFLDKYPEIVAKLDIVNWPLFVNVLYKHGDLYAAVHLEPFLPKVEGEKRAALAAMLAMLSHGNHDEAVAIVRLACSDQSQDVKKVAEIVLPRIEDAAFQAETDVLDALTCDVMPGDWAVMRNEKRWETIKRCVGRGGGRRVRRAPGEEFYLRAARDIDLENWFQLGTTCAYDGQMISAVWLSPLIPYLKGDKRIMLAALVGLLSHGNSPMAATVLESASDGAEDPRVLKLAASVQRFLGIRQQGLALLDRRYPEKWNLTPLPERWEEMRESVLLSNADLYHH